MNTETISVLSNGEIRMLDLINQLDEYIKIKQSDYKRELSENNFKILPWRKLELITAYKNNALMYEDVPEYIKERHLLPSRDEGIDVIKIENNEITKVFQCKCYMSHTVNKSHLKSFYQYQQLKHGLNNVDFIVVGSLTTKINRAIRFVKYDINEYFENTIERKSEIIINNVQNFETILRHYQVEAISKIKKSYDNKEFKINIKMPCGCGKTMLMYYFGIKKYNILIVVPKISIADQIKETFENNYGINLNCYWTNHEVDNNSNVTLCVYNSINKVILNSYDIAFIDEAHHIISPKLYSKSQRQMDMNIKPLDSDYITSILNIDTKLTVNLSATLDLNENGYEYKFEKAISEGYLTDYEINILYVDKLFDNGINNDYNQIVRVINENKEYKHIIIYCNRIETAESCNRLLNNNNIVSYVVTSDMTTNQREKRISDFRNGLVRVICCVNCLNEGTDLPIADTCMFLNDRHGEINIIQCIGRILRLHKYKNKARIVLFDTNSIEANIKGDYYLKVLCKYDNFFKEKLQRRIKIYDHTSSKQVNIQLKRTIYFDKIIKFRLTWDQKIELCKEYISEFGNTWPKRNEMYKNWHIGRFISDLKFKSKNEKKEILENLFNNELIIKSQLTNEQWLKLNREFKNEFGRLPKSKEIYRDYDIGGFIHRIINQGQHKDIKGELEEIYGVKLEVTHNKNIYSEIQILEFNQEFYNTNKRLPKQHEKINDFEIGRFINRLKQGQTPHLKEKIEQIYKQKIEVTKKHKQYIERDDDFKFEKCQEFYDKFNRRPNSKEEYDEEAGFSLYEFINNVLRSNDEKRKQKIISIFNMSEEDLNKPKITRVTSEDSSIPQVKAVLEYYRIHKTLPTNSRKKAPFNGFDISSLYQEAKRERGVGVYVRAALEKEGYVFPERKKKKQIDPEIKLKAYEEALQQGVRITSTNKKFKSELWDEPIDLYEFCQGIRHNRVGYAEEYSPILSEIEEKYGYEPDTHDRYTPEQQIAAFRTFYSIHHRMPVKYDGKDYVEIEVNGERKRYDIGSRYKKIMDPKYMKNHWEFVSIIDNIPNEFK